jgi:16S rRNA (cytidine1402-2'-O)-methyltransferase
MAMMSSGMNGQNFAFNGYLPIDKSDRKKAIKDLERLSKDKNQSQIFIETPYRNEKMFADLKSTLTPTTNLCIAADITLPSEYIKTLMVKDWKNQQPDLHKKPAIFIIHK